MSTTLLISKWYFWHLLCAFTAHILHFLLVRREVRDSYPTFYWRRERTDQEGGLKPRFGREYCLVCAVVGFFLPDYSRWKEVRVQRLGPPSWPVLLHHGILTPVCTESQIELKTLPSPGLRIWSVIIRKGMLSWNIYDLNILTFATVSFIIYRDPWCVRCVMNIIETSINILIIITLCSSNRCNLAHCTGSRKEQPLCAAMKNSFTPICTISYIPIWKRNQMWLLCSHSDRSV